MPSKTTSNPPEHLTTTLLWLTMPICLLLLACQTPPAPAAESPKHTVSHTGQSQDNTQAPSVNGDNSLSPLPVVPPLLFLRGPWQSAPGVAIELALTRCLADETNIDIYRVETPVEILSALASLDPARLPAGVGRSLALARARKTPALPAATMPWLEAETPCGEFTWVSGCRHGGCGSDGLWRQETVRLPALSSGFYLAEARLGPQVAHWPFVVSSLRSLAVCLPDTVCVWLHDPAMPADKRLQVFYADRKADWQQAQCDGQGLLQLRLAAGNWWLLARSEQQWHANVVTVPTSIPMPDIPPNGLVDDIEGRRRQPGVGGLHLLDNKNSLPCGTVIGLEWQSDGLAARQEVILLKRQDGQNYAEVERQERLLQRGKAQYFFAPAEAGDYEARAGQDRVFFTLYDPAQVLPHMRIVETACLAGQRFHLMVPGRNVRQWLLVDDGKVVMHNEILPVFTVNREIELIATDSGYVRVRLFYRQQEWREESLLLPVKKGSDMQPQQPVLGKSELATPQCSAAGHTVPELHRQWVQEKATAACAAATMASTRQNFSQAIQICRQLLRLIPGEPQVTALLAAVIARVQHSTSGQRQFVLLLLEQQVTFAQRSLPLPQFFDVVAQASGVCCELDLQAYERLPQHLREIDGLPTQTDALSILNYVLEQRKLVYKIESGVVYVTDAIGMSEDFSLERQERRLPALPLLDATKQ